MPGKAAGMSLEARLHRRPELDHPAVDMAAAEALTCAIRELPDDTSVGAIQRTAEQSAEVLAHAWQQVLSSEAVDRHTVNRAANLLLLARRHMERS